MTKTYQVTYITIKTFDITDMEMYDYGYESEITDDMREEYLQNLLADEYDPLEYDDRKIVEIKR